LFVPVCGGAIFPVPAASTAAAVASCSSSNNGTASGAMMMDELNRLVSYQQQQQYCYNVQNNIPNPNPNNHFSALLMQPMSLPNQLPTNFSDRLWDWNPIPEDHNNHPNSSSNNTTSFK
jgi:hypothetical protein